VWFEESTTISKCALLAEMIGILISSQQSIQLTDAFRSQRINHMVFLLAHIRYKEKSIRTNWEIACSTKKSLWR
jgi:hypothetical protein